MDETNMSDAVEGPHRFIVGRTRELDLCRTAFGRMLARATNDEAMRTLIRIAHVDLIRLARLHLAVYRIPQRGFTPLARYRSTALDGSAYAFALLGALFRRHNRLVGLRHRLLGCSVDAGRISVLREGIELAELLTCLGGTVLDALLQLNRP